MQLNKGKRETRASARNERRYYLSLPSTAFEYRSREIRFSLFARYLRKNCHWPVLPGFRGSLPPHPYKASATAALRQHMAYVCVRVYVSMHACAIPGSRYCNFKDRSGIADRYSDPKYRFRLRRSVPLMFARMSSFRSACVSSRGCSATSADLFREAMWNKYFLEISIYTILLLQKV